MVRLTSNAFFVAMHFPGVFSSHSCVPSTTDDGIMTCASDAPMVGSALLQKHSTKIMAVHQMNDTDVEEEENAENLLEAQQQHQLAAQLLARHQKTSRVGQAFSQYRLTIDDNYGAQGCGGRSSCVQVAEINLYHGDEEINYEGAAFEQGAGENSPRRERAEKAFDNDPSTKYLARRGAAVKVLTITLGTPAEVDKISFTTANDVPARDPKRFHLEGSNDGSTWEMVLDHSAEDYPHDDARQTEGEKCAASAGGAGEAPAADEPAQAPPADSSGGSGSGSGGAGGSGGTGGEPAEEEPAEEEPAAEEPADAPAGAEGGEEPWVALVNAKRADHGACPLTWAQPLADGIKEWVDGLTSLVHADSYHIPPPGGPCGENLAWASNGITAEQAVEMWYNEVNDCANPLPGCQDPLPGKMTGHFTAMVWKGAKTMGCAISADGNYAGCRWKAGDTLSADTPNMAMPGLYEANVGVAGEAPTGC